MSKPLPIGRSVTVVCGKCGDKQSVPLLLRADDQPIDCASCGARVISMGEVIDATVQIVAERLGAGLKRRAGIKR